MTLSLGIDVGTSGVRTAVVDASGQVRSMARASHIDQPEGMIHADHWWTAVRVCIGSQIKSLRELGLDPSEIRHVTVDGTSGTMVLTDKEIVPVGGALMYNSSGFAGEASVIAEFAPSSHITQGPSSALARAMRLIAQDTDKHAEHLLHQADFIAAKLIGRGGFSDHNNSLKTGFDPETEEWPSWIDKVIDPRLLPQPVAVGTPIGVMRSELVQEFGLSSETMVHAGTTDSIAAFVASSPIKIGNAVTSIGSTLAIKLLSTLRLDDPSIGLYSHRLGDAWLIGGASNTGGAVLAHYFSVEEIQSMSASIDPDQSPKLDFYPLIRPGERFPINDPDLAPRVTPRPADDATFLHGLLEGIAAIEALCYDVIESRGGGYPDRVYSAGGASENETLLSIRSRHLKAPINTASASEAAIGAALCATMINEN